MNTKIQIITSPVDDTSKHEDKVNNYCEGKLVLNIENLIAHNFHFTSNGRLITFITYSVNSTKGSD